MSNPIWSADDQNRALRTIFRDMAKGNGQPESNYNFEYFKSTVLDSPAGSYLFLLLITTMEKQRVADILAEGLPPDGVSLIELSQWLERNVA